VVYNKGSTLYWTCKHDQNFRHFYFSKWPPSQQCRRSVTASQQKFLEVTRKTTETLQNGFIMLTRLSFDKILQRHGDINSCELITYYRLAKCLTPGPWSQECRYMTAVSTRRMIPSSSSVLESSRASEYKNFRNRLTLRMTKQYHLWSPHTNVNICQANTPTKMRNFVT
jgi:hypothetical protein